jgi:transcriptional regulator with XRE-family HTH domain
VNELRDRLTEEFADEEARYAYAESLVNTYVSEQIRRLMDDRGLSQEELGALIGTKQSGISRLQKRDYSAWKVETLRKVARAFGVRLCISFEEFGTILEDVGSFTPENLTPRAFRNDPVFYPPAETKRRERKAARAHAPTIDKEDSAISSRRPTTGVSKKRSRRTDSRRRPARAASQRRKR